MFLGDGFPPQRGDSTDKLPTNPNSPSPLKFSGLVGANLLQNLPTFEQSIAAVREVTRNGINEISATLKQAEKDILQTKLPDLVTFSPPAERAISAAERVCCPTIQPPSFYWLRFMLKQRLMP